MGDLRRDEPIRVRAVWRSVFSRTQAPAWARNSAKLRFARTTRRAAKREAELRGTACPSRAWVENTHGREVTGGTVRPPSRGANNNDGMTSVRNSLWFAIAIAIAIGGFVGFWTAFALFFTYREPLGDWAHRFV